MNPLVCVLVTLFGLLQLATALNQSIIYNECHFPVYVFGVPGIAAGHTSAWDGYKGPIPNLPEHTPIRLESGSCFTHDYIWLPQGTGLSWKIATEPYLNAPQGHPSLRMGEPLPIFQFEYTMYRDSVHGAMINLDLSNVDCEGHQTIQGECPFAKHGMYLTSKGSDKTVGCPTRTCRPVEGCGSDDYTVWNEDVANAGCRIEHDHHNTELYLCRSTPPNAHLSRNLKRRTCQGLTYGPTPRDGVTKRDDDSSVSTIDANVKPPSWFELKNLLGFLFHAVNTDKGTNFTSPAFPGRVLRIFPVSHHKEINITRVATVRELWVFPMNHTKGTNSTGTATLDRVLRMFPINHTSEKQSSGLHGGVIAAVAATIIGGLFVIGASVWCCIRPGRRSSDKKL